jgi:competence protein ComEA
MKKLLLILAFFSANAFATPVNVNTADAQTIASSLAGIGLKKAEAIVADRVKNGLSKARRI